MQATFSKKKYKENTQDDQDGSSRQKILMGYF
jgi:hypothetical protein